MPHPAEMQSMLADGILVSLHALPAKGKSLAMNIFVEALERAGWIIDIVDHEAHEMLIRMPNRGTN